MAVFLKRDQILQLFQCWKIGAHKSTPFIIMGHIIVFNDDSSNI
jgi:hypothetical protein